MISRRFLSALMLATVLVLSAGCDDEEKKNNGDTKPTADTRPTPGTPAKPNASALSFSVDEDQSKVVALNGTASGGRALTFTIVSPPSHGTLSGTAPTITYAPSPDYHGADSFTFKVNDGLKDSDEAAVSITVNSVNDAPVAKDVELEVIDREGKAVPLLISDVDGDTLIPSAVIPPAHGTVTVSGSQLFYLPSFGYRGSDEFTYRVSDGQAYSYPHKVTISARERFCFRSLPALPKSEDLHVVSVYEALDNSLPPGAGNRKGTIPVVVRKAATPVTLVLSSYEPVHWKLMPESGAQIAKVIIQGYNYNDSSLEGVDLATPVEKKAGSCAYGWEHEFNTGGCSYTSVINAVRSAASKIETSFQGSYSGVSFTIPYSISSLKTVSSYYRVSDQECRDICTLPATDGHFASFDPASTTGSSLSKVSLSNQELTATLPSGPINAGGDSVLANVGKRCGKAYFEIRNDTKGASFGFSSGIGITSGAVPTFSYYTEGALFGEWGQGDIVGVAIDLDNDKVNLHVDGTWKYGDPINPASGRALNSVVYRIYRSFVYLLPGDSFTANFGASPFEYSVPAGYESGLK